MAQDMANFRNHLDALRLRGNRLAASLQVEADRLEQDGTPPSANLFDELTSLYAEIRSLQNEVQTTLQRAVPDDFSGIEQALADQESVVLADRTLRRLLCLKHHDKTDFEPLTQLQTEVTRLTTQLPLAESERSSAAREQIASLLTGTHPWCSLLKLVERSEELNDDEWSLLNTRVEQVLGHPLAVAAARGRLMFDDRSNIESPITSDTTATSTASVAIDIQPKESKPKVDEETQTDANAKTSTKSESIVETKSDVNEKAQSPDIANPIPWSEESFLLDDDDVTEGGTNETTSAAVGLPNSDLPNVDLLSEKLSVPKQPTVEHSVVEFPEVEVPLLDCELTTSDDPKVAAESDEETSGSIFDEIGTVSSERAELARFRRNEPSVASPLPHVHATRDEFPPTEINGDIEAILEPSELWPDASDSHTSIPHEADQFETPDPELKLLAEKCLSLSGVSRDKAIASLIWRLIYEGRVGMAWHLSRGLEAKEASVRFVPSWLISAWATGLWILYPKGQLATRLADDLEHFSSTAVDSRSNDLLENDWFRAISLLIRAATLRAAIIAPNTRAAAIVRAFPLRDGEQNLYNYCSRIGANGEKLNGFYPGILKTQLSEEKQQEELRLLQSEVRRWRQETATWAIRFEPTKPLFHYGHWTLRTGTAQRHPDQVALWPKWMHTLRLADEVLAPILNDEVSDLPSVRSAVDRLSTRVVVGSSNDFPSGSNAIVVPVAEMRRYVREATTFAHRWLTLRGRISGDAKGFLPQAAEALISDVKQRHDELFEELQHNVAESESSELRTATACLMLAAQQVREMLDPRSPLPMHEPDVRHLLHAELLRFPDFTLDSDWLPDVPPIALADKLLVSMTKPQPDWRTTFRMHERRQDHVATERLLMLNVWSESQRHELTARRHERLEASRRQLAATLLETTQLVRDAVDLKQISSQEVPEIDAVLEDFQYRIEKSADMGNLSRQIHRLKGVMEQRVPAHLRTRVSIEQGLPKSSETSPPQPSSGGSLLFDDFD